MSDTALDASDLRISIAPEIDGDGCRAIASLIGPITQTDFLSQRQISANFDDVDVVQDSLGSSVELRFTGTVANSCLGAVALFTDEPLRVGFDDPCFSAGRLRVQRAGRSVAAAFRDGGGVDLDLGADGSVEHTFSTCAEMPVCSDP